jgi:hypothetical protein
MQMYLKLKLNGLVTKGLCMQWTRCFLTKKLGYGIGPFFKNCFRYTGTDTHIQNFSILALLS